MGGAMGAGGIAAGDAVTGAGAAALGLAPPSLGLASSPLAPPLLALEEARIAQKETAPARGKLRPGVLPNEVPRLGKSARSDKPQLRTSFHRPVAVFLPTHEPWHQILNFAKGLPKRCRAGTPSPTIPLRFSGMAKAVPVRARRHPDEER
jgi:hypothetical protein